MHSNYLTRLNPQQRQAVEQIYGPVLVMAGPGTGKTHMLTARIAHILSTDVGCEAENILCLTFTESAAVEMRNRLQTWIGPTAYRVKIATFHGFCQWVMDQYPSIFQPKIGIREVADDLVSALAYRTVITSKKWEYFSNVWDDFMHQRDVLGAIGSCKREHLTPEKLRTMIPDEKTRLEADPSNFYKRKFREFQAGDWKPQAKQKIADKIAKMYEFTDLWEAYESELANRGYYDFNDMINWVVGEVEDNEILRLDLQERFQWIMVDEYQDTNNAQNAILWQLTEGIEEANIFAVGDDDQSIYRFQGASIANIRDFRNRFPKRLEVVLENNYRSHQHILDTAYASVSRNSHRANVDKKLIAQAEGLSGKITRATFGSRYGEINFLAKTILEKINNGTPAHEIAVLVRKNKEIEELARELPKFGVPVSAQIAQNIFENETVRQLILMLEIFSDVKHDESFFDLLHSDFLDIDPNILLKLSLERYKERSSIIERLLEPEFATSPINDFITFFLKARKNLYHCRPAVLAEKMLYESGLADFLTRENRIEDWQNIRKFIDWIRTQNLENLKDLLDQITLHRDLSITIRPDPLPADKKSVQIMTAHKSKGMEFQIVFLPGLVDKTWGNTRNFGGIPLPQITNYKLQTTSGGAMLTNENPKLKTDKTKVESDDNEEERRIFFVALTRAKSEIFLSYAETDFTGRAKSPSQFWHEVPDALMTDLTGEMLEEDLQKLLPVFFKHQEKTLTKGEREVLEPRIKNFVWSASSLQTFLDCPRRFLYQNLYKFPRRPQAPLALGVALHEALERFLKQSKSMEQFGTKEELKHLYQHALLGQPLPKSDFEKLLEHGQKILEDYYDQKIINFGEQYPFGYELEYNFRPLNPHIEDIAITGKLDKVEFLDEQQQSVKIIDYKSGKPRAIKKGEAYWRQLVFYDLLVRQAKGLNWKVEECAIEFLTSGSNGKIGERSLIISEDDRRQVIDELKACHEKLQNLEFPLVPNPEGDRDIDFWQNFGR